MSEGEKAKSLKNPSKLGSSEVIVDENTHNPSIYADSVDFVFRLGSGILKFEQIAQELKAYLDES